MKMEEMSLSGLDNSKLEVRAPHVCLWFFLLMSLPRCIWHLCQRGIWVVSLVP